jgi:hypothetical protein
MNPNEQPNRIRIDHTRGRRRFKWQSSYRWQGKYCLPGESRHHEIDSNFSRSRKVRIRGLDDASVQLLLWRNLPPCPALSPSSRPRYSQNTYISMHTEIGRATFREFVPQKLEIYTLETLYRIPALTQKRGPIRLVFTYRSLLL